MVPRKTFPLMLCLMGKGDARRRTREAEAVRVARRDDGTGSQHPFNMKGFRGGLPADVFGRRTGRGSAAGFSVDAVSDGKRYLAVRAAEGLLIWGRENG